MNFSQSLTLAESDGYLKTFWNPLSRELNKHSNLILFWCPWIFLLSLIFKLPDGEPVHHSVLLIFFSNLASQNKYLENKYCTSIFFMLIFAIKKC